MAGVLVVAVVLISVTGSAGAAFVDSDSVAVGAV